jgi:hypothetical protein
MKVIQATGRCGVAVPRRLLDRLLGIVQSPPTRSLQIGFRGRHQIRTTG